MNLARCRTEFSHLSGEEAVRAISSNGSSTAFVHSYSSPGLYKNWRMTMISPAVRIACGSLWVAFFVALTGCQDGGGPTPVVDGDDGGPTPVVDDSASKEYSQLVAEVSLLREKPGETLHDVQVSDSAKPGERREGESYVEYTELNFRAAANLKDLVFQDNSDGYVYPGSLLWTKPLKDGRLMPLPKIKNRPPVATAVVGGSVVNDEDAMSSNDGTFTHDGTFFDFQRHAVPFVNRIDRTSPKLAIQIGYGRNLKSALLDVGVSASVWVGSFDAGLTHSSSEQRSCAVLSLNEVYYTIVADTPESGGYFPPSLLDADPAVADLVLKDLKEYGEIGYVRSVKYGRRVLIAVSATATEEQLKRSLNLSAGAIGLSFSGSVDDETKKVWESMVSSVVVIGGKSTPSLADCVTGGPDGFLTSVNQYLQDTAVFDANTGPVPVSFEVRYVSDNEPMVNYETAEFAGQIEGRHYRAEETVPRGVVVSLGASDAILVNEDAEIDSDDWTLVRVQYGLQVAGDARSVEVVLTMDALEGEEGKFYNDQTHIQTSKTIRVFELPADDPRRILTVSAVEVQSSQEQWYGGPDLFNEMGFPNFGALHDIFVRIDSDGGDDRPAQKLTATIDFVVEIARER